MKVNLRARKVKGEHFYDILEYYKEIPEIYNEIKQLIEDSDIQLEKDEYSLYEFDRLINWVEQNLGEANARSAGRRVFKKFFNSNFGESEAIRSVNELARIGEKINEKLQDQAVLLDIEYDNNILMIRTKSEFNKKFQLGFIEEFLSRINNCYFIREQHSNKETEKNELMLIYKTVAF